MRKIDKLKKEAIECAKFRGHSMTRFTRMHHKTKTSVSRCKKCSMTVYVQDYCLPNEIDISGQAIALTCSGESK